MRCALVVLRACNQAFGLHQTQQQPSADARFLDAPIDAPYSCPPIGTAPQWSCPYSCVDAVGALPTKNGDSPGCKTKEKHKRPKRSRRDEAADLVIPMQADFEPDLAARCRDAVRATIQVVLDEELERLVGAGPYERSDQRVDVRNGRYPRRIVTTAGEVDLRVGRTRGGGSATAPLGRYAGRRPEIDAAITQSYVAGVSTRDMAAVTEALLDKPSAVRR